MSIEAARRLVQQHLVHKPYNGTMVEGRLLLDAGPSERGWHLLSTGLRCPQLRAYTEKLKIRFRWSDPLTRGALIHMGSAHFYRRIQAIQEGDDPDQWHTPVDAMRVFTARMDTGPGRNPRSAAFSDWLDPCVALFDQVEANFRIRRRGEYILAVEQPFHALVQAFDGQTNWSFDEAETEWLFSQRGDLVIYDSDTGLIYIEDHKSTARKDPRQIRSYFRSGQFQGYWNFGKGMLGDLFGGVRINLYTFGTKRRDGTVSTKPGVERLEVPYLPHRGAQFINTIRWGERQWQDAQRLFGENYFDYPKVGIDNGDCEHRYGECDGAELCDYGPNHRAVVEGDDEAYRKHKSWIQEV